jgi:signal transduction histidine kinase
MDVSRDSGSRLMGLIESMLDIAKLERREMPLNRQPVAIKELIDGAHKALFATVQEAQVEVEFSVPDNLPDVHVDPELTRRVLINLLGNALRYTPSQGKILISANLTRQQDRVIVRVADSGRGIPPEERERIFEKYRQVQGSTPYRGGRGTGLGLTFCKLVVEQHGERIWVEPESPLSGACFAFTLPINAETHPPIPLPSDSAEKK